MIKSWTGVFVSILVWYLVYDSIQTGEFGLRSGSAIVFAEDPIVYSVVVIFLIYIAIRATYAIFNGNHGN